MKISEKILSLPPHLSTSWKNVVSIQVEARPFGHVLVIELVTGNKVEIPNLERHVLEKVFLTHVKVVEEDGKDQNNSLMTAVLPFSFNFPALGGMFQHNPDQKDAPLLPAEIVEKISAMMKGVLPENFSSSVTPPEPDCHCHYCQIMQAILGTSVSAEPKEEAVTEEDLKFRSWDIKPQGDKCYEVVNPLDQKEHYSVFLGDPLGCTCGQKNCEHIQAVLKS